MSSANTSSDLGVDKPQQIVNYVLICNRLVPPLHLDKKTQFDRVQVDNFDWTVEQLVQEIVKACPLLDSPFSKFDLIEKVSSCQYFLFHRFTLFRTIIGRIQKAFRL